MQGRIYSKEFYEGASTHRAYAATGCVDSWPTNPYNDSKHSLQKWIDWGNGWAFYESVPQVVIINLTAVRM